MTKKQVLADEYTHDQLYYSANAEHHHMLHFLAHQEDISGQKRKRIRTLIKLYVKKYHKRKTYEHASMIRSDYLIDVRDEHATVTIHTVASKCEFIVGHDTHRLSLDLS